MFTVILYCNTVNVIFSFFTRKSYIGEESFRQGILCYENNIEKVIEEEKSYTIHEI
jgi:hypothetical protein